LSNRWIPLSELSEILGYSQEQTYQQLVILAKQTFHYTVLVRDGGEEPVILVIPRAEWRNLLRYVALFPRF